MANDKRMDNLTPFSKDYQPPNESKRVPKTRTRIKEIINKHWDVFEEMIKSKNTAAWKMAIDEISEKTSKIDLTSKGDKIGLSITDLRNAYLELKKNDK